MENNPGIGKTISNVTECCMVESYGNGNNCKAPLYVIFTISEGETPFYGYCQQHWGSGHSYHPVKFVTEVTEVTEVEKKMSFSAKAVIIPEYRTQKAVGLKALRDNNFNTPAFDIYGVEHFDYASPYDKPVYTEEVNKLFSRINELERLMGESSGDQKTYLQYAISGLKNQVHYSKSSVIGTQLGLFQERSGLSRMVNKFVRPCPMVPRHGFVDSRPVNTVEEAESLLEETLKAEDKAEFIVMPFIKAEYSGIWTNGKLVIGTGNDGATAGHSSRLIPALGIPTTQEYKWKDTLSKARITETPYVELLWAKKYDYDDMMINYFVQLRNGPALPDTTDYIPEEIKITNVILAEGDLLEWEAKAKEFSRGTCIYHPGGSLASHYAVHAVLAKLPVLISRKPEIGEVLKPNTEVHEPNLDTIRSGFYMGATLPISFQKAAYCMLVGCHSTSVWLGRQDLLLGFAMGCAYRLTITAALGEYRHEPGRKRKPKRESVYTGVWNKILLPSTRTRYMKALDSFLNNKKWPGSFGGKKWYVFASYAASIYNSILDGNIQESLQNLNKCVNAVHNSGWGFDKFVSNAILDQTAKSPSVTLLAIAPELYEIMMKGEKERYEDWFKGKHHVEVEPLDEDAAKRDEEEEAANGTEVNTLNDEEGCDCSICQREKSKRDKKVKVKKDQVDVYGCYPCECGPSDCTEFSGTYILNTNLNKVCTPCTTHLWAYSGSDYKKLTPEEVTAHIKEFKQKNIKEGVITEAQLTLDSVGGVWIQYKVANQAEMGQNYQLNSIPVTPNSLKGIKKQISLAGSKAVAGYNGGVYYPLKMIGDYGYLHAGDPNDIYNSWSNTTGYVCFDLKTKTHLSNNKC